MYHNNICCIIYLKGYYQDKIGFRKIYRVAVVYFFLSALFAQVAFVVVNFFIPLIAFWMFAVF